MLKGKCPLAVVFILCTALYALTGFRFTALEGRSDSETAAIATFAETAPANPATETAEEPDGEAAAAADPETAGDISDGDDMKIAAGGEEEHDPETQGPITEVSEGSDPASASREQPEEAPHLVIGETEPDYFRDALFIGDSRTVGLYEYCEELSTRATFYAKVSLTVNNALDLAFVKTEDGKKSVDELLDERQFGKIYLMLGLNEIGGGTEESFAEDYRQMLERIRAKQPDALILIQSIMHVTGKKSAGDRVFNNPRINARNDAIAALADEEKRIWYLDMNEALDDEDGNLTASLSFDDVHLKASSYVLWYDYLLKHALIPEEVRHDPSDDL
ncbi:MAG: hypothetical protein K6G16_03945 [Lachnospiraceae bacterium]|nr:hypothetical protein [Lachnospiraceae bacterium]